MCRGSQPWLSVTASSCHDVSSSCAAAVCSGTVAGQRLSAADADVGGGWAGHGHEHHLSGFRWAA